MADDQYLQQKVSSNEGLPMRANDVGNSEFAAVQADAGTRYNAAHLVTNSADASTGVNITSAAAAATKKVMQEMLISVGSALAITIKEETSGTVMHGPLYMAANTTLQLKPRSVQLSKLATAVKKYQVFASGAGNVTVETWSYDEA